MSNVGSNPLDPPVLKSIVFNGNAIIANWELAPGAGNYYKITLFENGNPVNSSYALNTSGMILNVTPNPQKSYSVKVAQTDSTYANPGPFSNEISVVTAAPSQIQVNCDGKQLDIYWSPIEALGYDQSARISLFDKASSTLLESVDVEDTNAIFKPSRAFDPSKQYMLTVACFVPGSTGPNSSPIDVIQDTIGIRDLAYNSTSVIADIDKPTASLYFPVLYLYDGSTTVQNAQGMGTRIILNLPGPLDTWQHYEVRVAVMTSGSRGPLSRPMRVLNGMLELQEVSCEGTTLSASWHRALQDFAFTGATMLLFQGNTLISNCSFTGYSGSMELSKPLDPNLSYSLSAAPFYGPSRGMNSASLPVLTAAPQISSVQYDGDKVFASWHYTPPAGINAGYILSIHDEQNVQIASLCTGGLNGCIKCSLIPGGSYSVNVQAISESSKSSSGKSPIITSTPGISSVTTRSEDILVTLQLQAPTPAPNVTGYSVYLYRNGNVVAGPFSPPSGSNQVVVVYKVDDLCTYSVRVQATGNNCSGPLSDDTHAISATPAIEFVDYDGTNASVCWNAVTDAAVTGYKVLLRDKASGSVQTFFSQQPCITVPADPSKNYSVQVQAAGNSSLGAASSSVDILNEKIAPTSAAYDGSFIHTAWAASTTPSAAYEVLLFEGNNTVQTLTVTTNSAAIPAALDAGGLYSIGLRVIKDGIKAPLGGKLALISAIPGVRSITSDTGKVTVQIDDSGCKGKPGISAYQALLYQGGEMVSGPVTASADLKAVFAYNLDPCHTYSVRVQATGNSCSGPLSNDTHVISAVPAIESVDYDGSTVRASWSQSSDILAASYEAILTPVANPANAITVKTSTTHVEIPLDCTTASGTYTLCVCATADNSRGSFSSTVDPIGSGLCLSAQRDAAPAVMPALSSLPAAAYEVACYLPELYKTVPSTLPSSGPFVLTALTGAGDFKYKISFSSDNDVWKFDNSPIRNALKDSYINFLLSIEGKLADQPPATIGVPLQGAIHTVIKAIARTIPQTFAETLYYSCGLLAQNNYADLRPGMRLRIEYQQWQTVSSSPAPQTYVNGYTGNSTVEYDIGSYRNSAGSLLTSFNSFLCCMEGVNLPSPNGSAAGPIDGGGGNMDMFFREFRQPFYRLFYPGTLKTPGDSGSSYPKDNAMILAAADWYTLTDITKKIIQGSIGSIPAIGSNYAMLYMRGRALMTPLVCITLNGAKQWVPVGTTLRQILEQNASDPLNISASIDGLFYTRAWEGMYTGITTGRLSFDPSYRIPIRIQWGKSCVYVNSSDWFSLPVLHGDKIDLTGERI